jgi:hypothetical protein
MAKSSSFAGESLIFKDRSSIPTQYEGELIKVLGELYFWDPNADQYLKAGSGTGGGGGFNYVEANPSAEFNTDGWTAYATTSPNVAPVDFGGTPNGDFTLTRNTTNPLTDVADFELTKTANNRRGHGYYFEADIQNADLASIIRTALNYKTSVNYADGFIRVYYVTSADNFTTRNVIELSQRDVDATSLAKLYLSEGQFLSTDTKVRICIHVATDTATAWTFNFARVSVSPREIARGPMVTDWTPLTDTQVKDLTDVDSNITYTSAWRRVGSNLEWRVRGVYSGVGGSDILQYTLPFGLSLDTSHIINDTHDINFGTGTVRDDSASDSLEMSVNMQSSTVLRLNRKPNNDANFHITPIAMTENAIVQLTTNDEIYFYANIPILGWSSNQTISSDFGGRSLSAYAYRSGNQTGVNPNNTAVLVQINSVTPTTLGRGYDDAASVNTSTYRYICQESGEYEPYGQITVLAPNVLNSAYAALLFVNGSFAVEGNYITPNTGATFGCSVSGRFKLNKGDYIELHLFGVGNNSASTLTIASGAASTYLLVKKVATPQTLAGGEKVVARYTTAAGQSIANATNAIIDFGTKTYDTHNAATTGASWKWTAPYSVKVEVDCTIGFNTSLTWTANSYAFLALYKNGSLYSYGNIYTVVSTFTNTASGVAVSLLDTIDLVAGDYIHVTVTHGESSARAMRAVSGINYINIKKVN